MYHEKWAQPFVLQQQPVGPGCLGVWERQMFSHVIVQFPTVLELQSSVGCSHVSLLQVVLPWSGLGSS